MSVHLKPQLAARNATEFHQHLSTASRSQILVFWEWTAVETNLLCMDPAQALALVSNLKLIVTSISLHYCCFQEYVGGD